MEQSKRANQINLLIEALSNQFRLFLATQMAGREIGANSEWILNTPTMGKEIGIHINQEWASQGFKSNICWINEHLGLSFYKKEYLAILMAVYKWRHYLKQEQSITQIDHEILKYLLDQKIHTTIQKKGLIKFLSLNY